MRVREEDEGDDGGRFLKEPLWFSLFVLCTACDGGCTSDAASLTEASLSPSAVRQSLLVAAVRGSWPLPTCVVLLKGGFPFALR